MMAPGISKQEYDEIGDICKLRPRKIPAILPYFHLNMQEV